MFRFLQPEPLFLWEQGVWVFNLNDKYSIWTAFNR